MIIASYSAGGFSFTAYGSTTSHARNALIRGLEEHAKQHKLEPVWWNEEDFVFKHIELNRAYRDGEMLGSYRFF